MTKKQYDELMKAYDKCEEDVKKKLGRDLTDYENLYITCNFFRYPKKTYEYFGLEYNEKN